MQGQGLGLGGQTVRQYGGWRLTHLTQRRCVVWCCWPRSPGTCRTCGSSRNRRTVAACPERCHTGRHRLKHYAALQLDSGGCKVQSFKVQSLSLNVQSGIKGAVRGLKAQTCLKQKGMVSTLTPTMLLTTFMTRPQFEAAMMEAGSLEGSVREGRGQTASVEMDDDLLCRKNTSQLQVNKSKRSQQRQINKSTRQTQFNKSTSSQQQVGNK